MKDTAPEIEAAYNAMFAAHSGSERLRMASDMFEAAKALVVANIRDQQPGITPVELRVQTFERLYAGDLTVSMHERIVAALRES